MEPQPAHRGKWARLRPSGLPNLLLHGHQFDPAVLRASFWRIVGSDKVGLPVSVRDELACWNTLPHQVIDDRVGAPLAEF